MMEGSVSFFDFFNRRPGTWQAASAAETDTVRKIVDALDHMDPERARYLGAFAYILSRVARADFHVSDEETETMQRTAEEHGLPAADARLVVEIAHHQSELFGATEDFLVTREFGRISSREEKLTLIDCLYAVAAAHEWISVAEDNVIRQVASELGLSHPEVIRVRSRFREHLSVLRKEGHGSSSA